MVKSRVYEVICQILPHWNKNLFLLIKVHPQPGVWMIIYSQIYSQAHWLYTVSNMFYLETNESKEISEGTLEVKWPELKKPSEEKANRLQ